MLEEKQLPIRRWHRTALLDHIVMLTSRSIPFSLPVPRFALLLQRPSPSLWLGGGRVAVLGRFCSLVSGHPC